MHCFAPRPGATPKSPMRIAAVLDGLAAPPAWGREILMVFDDDETCYRYVSRSCGRDGEFAASAGLFVNDGCGHFVTMKADLRVVEPTIVHGLTHSMPEPRRQPPVGATSCLTHQPARCRPSLPVRDLPSGRKLLRSLQRMG